MLAGAGGGKSDTGQDETLAGDLALFGAAPAQIAKLTKQQQDQTRHHDGPLDIEPENQAALRLFVRLATQWRWQTVAGLVSVSFRGGLDYDAAERVARTIGLAFDDDLLFRLQILEQETVGLDAARARAALNRR